MSISAVNSTMYLEFSLSVSVPCILILLIIKKYFLVKIKILQGVPENCSRFVLLVWRSCRFNYLTFYTVALVKLQIRVTLFA